MFSKDQARALLARRLSDDVVILDERTIEKDWGWVFFYQSKRFIKTQDPKERLLGNSPYIVNRFDGSIHCTDTKYSFDRYIQRYERQLTGEAPDFGGDPGAWLDYVTFDTTRYLYKGEPPAGPDDYERTWRTKDCTADINLRLTLLPPRLPSRAESIAQLEQLCQSQQRLLRMMDFRLVTLDGIDCIWELLTTPPEARTPCYFGEITIPFADFFFKLAISTSEEWASDGSEALSRLRREFTWVSRSLRVSNRVKSQKRFELPHHSA